MRAAKLHFYFAFPRLVAKAFGHNIPRSEGNQLEAQVVGAAVHSIAYLFAFELLLRDLVWWQQFLFAIPVAFLVWLCWLLLLYVNSVIVKLLRFLSLMRHLPDSRAQSVLIGILTTGFACHFFGAGGWLRAIAFIWFAAVFLNFLAALWLVITHADDAALT